MRIHKKTLGSVLVMMLMSIVMVGCGQKEEAVPIQIAALNGPTGIGMVKMMDEPLYDTTLYQSPDEIVGKVVSGEVDIACVPSNLAATLYNKTEGEIRLLATNTLGVLYIVEKGDTITSIDDLRGKTILASGKGSTPEYILNHVLQTQGIDPEKDVTIEYFANHSDIASQLTVTEGAIALLPQPFVTTVLAKDESVRVAIDLNEVWEAAEQMELPMGTIIASKSFVETRAKDLKQFLTDYEASVTFVNNNVDEAAALVVAYGIIANEGIAKKAIPECHIVYRDSAASKDSLNTFYEILSASEPKAIGGKLPDEDFYLKN